VTVDRDAARTAWTDDEVRRIGLLPHELDALLTPEEAAALHEHLRLLADQRRRVEAESRGLRMP